MAQAGFVGEDKTFSANLWFGALEDSLIETKYNRVIGFLNENGVSIEKTKMDL